MDKNLNIDFDIIILAGQSNAEGNGLGNEELICENDDKIYHIYDKNPTGFKDEDTNPVLQITLPMEKVFGVMEERDTVNGKAASFVDTFTRLYIKNGLLKDNRKLLVLRCAVGGTGFSRNEWGINSVLYKRLRDLADYALNLGGDNKIVALLWHQGEHDAFEQQQLTPTERYDYYFSHFSEQMNDFLHVYGEVPIIAGGFCPDEKKNDPPAYVAVENATKDYLSGIKTGGFVVSDGLLSNDQKISNGDHAHFCRESCIELGKRYFTVYCNFKKLK